MSLTAWWLVGAAIFKVWVNETRSLIASIATVSAALFLAWALMGEGIMRWLIGVANEPDQALELLKAHRDAGREAWIGLSA